MRPNYLPALLLATAHMALAQPLPPAPAHADQQALPVAVEFATFRAGRGMTTLEVYLEVPSPEEIIAAYGSQYVKELATAVLLKHRGQIIEFSDATLRDGSRRSRRSGRATGDAITSTTSLTAKPGEYDLQVVVEYRGGIAFDQTFSVTLPAYSYNELDLSDLVLARQVGWASPVAATSRLGLNVTPAVPPVFEQNKAWIWYMLEVYGLSPEDTVTLSISILNDSGMVAGPRLWQVPVPANTLAQRGALLFEHAPPGDYRFVAQIVAAGNSATQMAAFTIGDSLAAEDTLAALATFSKRDLKNLAADFKQVWSRFNARGFASAGSDEQLNRIGVLTTVMEGVAAGDLIDRWQLVRLLDAGRTRRRGLSARARLVLKHGPPQAVRIAPATFSQSESQLWIYGDEGPIYFLVDIDGRGTFAEVDGEQVPLFLLQSLAMAGSDSMSVTGAPPTVAVDTSAPIDSMIAPVPADTALVPPDTTASPVPADTTFAPPDTTAASMQN
ncbi:MAG: hypothetical protein IIA59_12365 [Candidatus Marinimicrobia bacterium]|nr:hypothetical protein [Candidatus Neomarinimicrobiota bacterium]